MKKISKKFFFVLAIMIICFMGVPYKVNASGGVSSYVYYHPNPITFTGTAYAGTRYYDGDYMAMELVATAADGVSRSISVTVTIGTTGVTKHYTIYTDGVRRKMDYIYIGGGSSVQIAFTNSSSVSATVDVTSYSW